MSAEIQELESHLKEFQLSSFRPGQREVIAAVLDGADCLCIMPTGGGKSLCYQLPAVVRDGVTLVISPLIALMKDQVDGLLQLGLRATFINSSLMPAEQHDRIYQMAAGAYDLVYIAPERLRSPAFLEAAGKSHVQLLAIDEAHCISEWGHDFRPDYSRIGQFRRRMGKPQTMALTATATPTVREDIIRQLDLPAAKTFITGFGRPNLRFEVQYPSSMREKDQQLKSFLKATDGAGIIYVATRKACEDIAERLSESLRRRVGTYHGGMLPEDRRKAQEAFMGGKLPIVVATNAFGMGIDKANLRFVVHYNMPGSLEAYYQEAGRAGRDGETARCLLLYTGNDRHIQEFFIENSYPSHETIESVYDFLCGFDADPIELTQQELKDRLELSTGAESVRVCEQLLEKSGALERLDSAQNAAAVRLDSDLPTLVDLLPKDAKARRKVLRAIEEIVGESRHERVFFQPRQLIERTEMKWDGITRALRDLNKLEAFDYVPPFRGRAIHMLKRDVAFDELDIDFDELERRRNSEYEKLERVVRYARTRQCRQWVILDYFGDPHKSQCHTCDNCQSEETSDQNAVTIDSPDDPILKNVQIVLSGVARIKQRFGERVEFGKNRIAQMLCGSQAAEISRWKLDSLSTFGLLKNLTQDEACTLIDALVRVELLQQVSVDRGRPVVRLTAKGSEVMRGACPVDEAILLPSALVAKLGRRQHKAQPAPANIEIEDSSQIPPRDEVHEPTEQRDSQSAARPNYYWTWQLLRDGYTLDDCFQIRGLAHEDVIDHLTRAVEDGLVVDPAWIFSPERFVQMKPFMSQLTKKGGLRPTDLPMGVRYEDVQLLCRILQEKQLAQE